jgi:uncharacterized membrane protein YraQ (UPF0718 family)
MAKLGKENARVINGVLFTMVALVAVLALVAWSRGGGEQLSRGLLRGVDMMVRFGLLIAVSFLAAGLIETLVPREWIREQLGADAGFKGLVLATGAGMVTPSGPFVAIPLAVAMLRAGASGAIVIAYVSAWGLISLHRLIAWEIPLLGIRMAMLRFALCLSIPALVGLAARFLYRSAPS